MLVTDSDGWVAAAIGTEATTRIALPDRRDSDCAWLPAYGSCRIEPVPGGWLVRVLDDSVAETPATTVELDLRRPQELRLLITSESARWSHRLSPRHAELMLLLATRPAGMSAAQLSEELYGSPDHAVTVRAEASRLRRHLVGLLLQRPYRLADWVDVHISYPDSPAELLPASTAPAVRRIRSGLPPAETTRSPRSPRRPARRRLPQPTVAQRPTPLVSDQP